MKAIILAAGKASRLGEITKDTPKSLLDISGKCSLGRMLENMRYSGIKDIYIVTGFQHGKICDYIQKEEFKNLYITTVYNKDWETTNNAYSLNLALELIDDDILVCNADVVCYKDLVRELMDFPQKNAMAIVRKKELNEEDMKVCLNLDKITIAEVSKQIPLEEGFGEFTGIFKIGEGLNYFKEDLEKIIENNSNAWFESALEYFIGYKDMYLCDISHYPYIEIDFPEDLEIARKMFK